MFQPTSAKPTLIPELYDPSRMFSSSIIFLPLLLSPLRIHAISDRYPSGWENINIDVHRKVDGFQSFVDLKATNSRKCIRMCWLFRTCSAVTFSLEQQRCLLYQMEKDHEAYRTVRARGSLAVDMRRVRKRLPAKVNLRLRPD
ncbi:hypothetical protein PoB_005410900 [Plakobranchus ocellatus]|uniref:Apple domain-containing protein n=1 Tax=Plakobranchus ocellatus TaxID=259542 RepID=A0AAV4C4Y1_9GAST|nr:hypothetical protein PoB_005410900 [Plakobranchus ocellatus]